jgi:hypothetical protein
MVTNYLFKMRVSMVILKSVVPSYNILLKLFLKLIKHFWQRVSHNGAKYTTLKKNVNKNFNKKRYGKSLTLAASRGPPELKSQD